MAACLIGIWPLPLTDEITRLLRLAADPAGVAIEQGHGWHTWTIHRDSELIGAAHVRRTTERAVEVHLVGGHDSKAWLSGLDAMLGDFARQEGANVLRAFGRRGWARRLIAQGWTATPLDDGGMLYERGLG